MLTWLRQGPVGFARRAYGYRSVDVARIVQRNLRTIVTPTHPAEGGIAIPELGIVIDPVRHEHILTVIPQLLSLKAQQSARFRMVEGALEIVLPGASFLTETVQDILTVHEIFEMRIYEFGYDGPAHVWDVGANVGIASIYFAARRGWSVSAYEPFPVTAESALRNIAQNSLEDRIDFHSAGIGGSERKETVLYHHAWRAGNGLFGNLHRGTLDEGSRVEIQILDAADAFRSVIDRAAGRPIIAKIDCEGAEYEILRRLLETGDLRKIHLVLLEVHEIPHEDFEAPRALLLQAGMAILRHERHAIGFQTIYAARVA